MNVDEPIHLSAYDEKWPLQYKAEHDRLRLRIASEIAGMEHFGSTSVPGMVAKPIIDIMVGVVDFQQTEGIIQALTGSGYDYLGEAGISGRLYFRRRGEHSFNVHVVTYEGNTWTTNCNIRDYLRTHLLEAQRYSEVKQQLVRRGIHTLLDYSDGKQDWMAGLADRANEWAGSV